MDLHKIYDFDTLAPSILGTNYKNMKVVLSGADFDFAKMFDNDLVTRHENVKQIVDGLPVNHKDLTYIVTENVNNEKTVFALEWLDNTSIVETGTVALNIKLVNMSVADIGTIRHLLIENGYGTNIEDITQVV